MKSHLLILQTQQQDILHQCQFGLLAPFLVFTDVAGIERDLVAILCTGKRRLRSTVIHRRSISGNW
jgi:hypothetical protein